MFNIFWALYVMFARQVIAQSQKMPKFQMVYLKWDWTMENKAEGTAKLSATWSQLLKSAQIEVMMLPMGPGKIMMMADKLKGARKYVLEQPEVD